MNISGFLTDDITIMGYTIGNPLGVLITLVLTLLLGYVGTKIILRIVRRILKKSNHLDDMLNTFVVNVVRVACIILVIAMCLDKLGVGAGTIVAVLGAAGAAIALALKDSLANVAGGLMIIITHPFKKGDLVDIGEYRGRVQEIDLFLTTLRTLNYQVITVPNGLINTSVLVNESREERRRVDLEFGISYDADIPKAKEILAGVCREAPLVLDDPAPSIGVLRHDDSAVVLELLAWCATEDYFKTDYYLKEEVKRAFDKGGISIPFPQVEVKVMRETAAEKTVRETEEVR